LCTVAHVASEAEEDFDESVADVVDTVAIGNQFILAVTLVMFIVN